MSENFFEIIDATHLKIKSGWSDTKKIASYYQIFGSTLAALLKNNPHDCKKKIQYRLLSLRGMTNSDRSVWN